MTSGSNRGGSAQSDGVNSTIMTSFAVIIGLFEQMNRTASTTTQNDRSRMEAHALKVWGGDCMEKSKWTRDDALNRGRENKST